MPDYMKIALDQAKKAYKTGNIPIGAVLIIDGKVIDKTHNTNYAKRTWNSHAESSLIAKHAALIRSAHNRKQDVTIYTTLEPCIMCFGTCVQNRITNIVYACPDPYGGATHLTPKHLREFTGQWPKSKQGKYRKESLQLFLKFISSCPGWESILPAFEKLAIRENLKKIHCASDRLH